MTFNADDYAKMTFEQSDVARPMTNSPDRSRAAPIVAYQQHGSDVAQMACLRSGRGDVQSGVPFVAAIAENQRGEIRESDIAPQLSCGGGKPGSGYAAVAFQTRIARNGRGQPKDVADSHSSDAGMHGDSKPHVAGAFGVRRLTTVECARLQGFPDDWLDCGLSNSAKYRALGNAVCVPVAEWIGRRIGAA